MCPDKKHFTQKSGQFFNPLFTPCFFDSIPQIILSTVFTVFTAEEFMSIIAIALSVFLYLLTFWRDTGIY